MNRVIGVFMLVLGCCAFLFLVFMVRYIWGFRKTNLIYVRGYTEKTETLKHVFRGHPFSGKWHKYWTKCTYVYRVSGQQYSICGGISGQKNTLPQSVNVAVQKNDPRKAFIPQFDRAPSKWILCFLFLGCSILLSAGFYLLFC